MTPYLTMMTIYLTDMTGLNTFKLNSIMPRIITLEEKIALIDDWLSGESRMDIATKRNVANGTCL